MNRTDTFKLIMNSYILIQLIAFMVTRSYINNIYVTMSFASTIFLTLFLMQYTLNYNFKVKCESCKKFITMNDIIVHDINEKYYHFKCKPKEN